MQNRCPQFMKIVNYIIILLFLTSCSVDKTVIVPAKYNGKYGAINSKGKWLIEPTFDSINNFYNGFADTYKNGKQGLINTKGKLVIDYKYDFIGLVENHRVLVRTENHYNFADLEGNLISKIPLSDAEDFSEELASVQFNENGKWGYIDVKGDLKIDTLFSLAYEFKNGLAEVEIETIDTTKSVNADYIVLTPKFYDCTINKSGKIIDTIKYIKKKRNFPLIGSANSNTLGKLNRFGDTIMQKKYRAFGYPQGKYMWYNTGEKYGLADTTGIILIKPIYEKLEYFSKNGLAVAKRDGKFGFINSNGEIIIDFIYNDAKGFKYDLAPVKINGKWGFINHKGKFKINPIYDNLIGHFRKLNGKTERIYEYSYE
jgi:WG containing repeat